VVVVLLLLLLLLLAHSGENLTPGLECLTGLDCTLCICSVHGTLCVGFPPA
jgi:hypothetical protein